METSSTQFNAVTAKTEPPSPSVAALEGASGNVIVQVGLEKKKYHVNMAFLSYYSDYFKKALNGSWKEADESIIPLSDVEPAVFNLFIDWLYTQKLPEGYQAWPAAERMDIRMLKLKLYVFADRFLVPLLHELVSQVIVCSERDCEYYDIRNYEEIIYAFNNLPSTDPLLDYFVDSNAMRWYIDADEDSSQKDLRSQLPCEFLLRFMLRVGKSRGLLGPHTETDQVTVDSCSYHVHHTEEGKQNCGLRAKLHTGKPWMQRQTL